MKKTYIVPVVELEKTYYMNSILISTSERTVSGGNALTNTDQGWNEEEE